MKHTKTKRQLENMTVSILLALAVNGVAYYGTRLYGPLRAPFDFTGGIDRMTPLVPWTVSVYLGAYLFWIVNYVLGCMQEEQASFRFMSADFFAKTVCLLCFLFLPTITERPSVTGTGFWNGIVSWLYHTDAADNLFPSIHCLTSWFSVIAVRNNPRIPDWYKTISLILAAAVCVSTLTTKQHILMDLFGGIMLAEASYAIVAATGFSSVYERVIRFINHKTLYTVFREIRPDMN